MGKKTDGQVVHPKKKHNDTNPDCVTSVGTNFIFQCNEREPSMIGKLNT